MKVKLRCTAVMVMAAVLLALCLTGCGEQRKREYQGFFFDTIVTVRVYGGSDAVLDGVEQLCREYDVMLSRTNPRSDIWKLNNADGAAVVVDERTAQLLTMAAEYTELSAGRFDVTCGAVTELWDFKSDSPVVPDNGALEKAVGTIGTEKINIDGCTVTLETGTQIDLGAIAKGYIADKTAEYIRLCGVENAVINFGGNVVVIGDKFGELYNVGIESPFGNGYAMSLKVADKSIVTAGTYQRGFTADGVYYHHILDLTTGMPADSGLASVTVISESSAQGDALATTLFLMGLTDGLALAEDIEGVEAVFITDDGDVICTSGI